MDAAGSGKAGGGALVGVGLKACAADCFAFAATGDGGVTGAGGVRATLGLGGSINCVTITTGMTLGGVCIKLPWYTAYISPACNSTTDKTMVAYRLVTGTGRNGEGAKQRKNKL